VPRVGRDRQHSYGRGRPFESVGRPDEEGKWETMESTPVWETPEFEEIGVAPEVTMYVAQID
jgi:coenzyme PQQ precursor peptide PqqA